MDASVMERVNNIGSEIPPVPPSSSSDPPKKRGNRKLSNWLLGFFLSWLPVLLGPFVRLLFKESLFQVLISVLTDVSIIYIGVSLIVSAMNDLAPEEHGRTNMYIGILVFAAAIYAIINAAQQFAGVDAVNVGVVIFMNVVFLLVPLVCGLHQYMRKTEVTV